MAALQAGNTDFLGIRSFKVNQIKGKKFNSKLDDQLVLSVGTMSVSVFSGEKPAGSFHYSELKKWSYDSTSKTLTILRKMKEKETKDSRGPGSVLFRCEGETGPEICKAMEQYAKDIVSKIVEERKSGTGPGRIAGKRRMSVAVDGIGGVMQELDKAAASLGGITEKSFRVVGVDMKEGGSIKKPLTLKVGQQSIQLFNEARPLNSWAYITMASWSFAKKKSELQVRPNVPPPLHGAPAPRSARLLSPARPGPLRQHRPCPCCAAAEAASSLSVLCCS